MSTIRLKSIVNDDNKITAVVNVAVSIDRSTGLDQDMTISKDEYGRWHATIALDDFPLKDSPEEAAERLSLWLKLLSKGVRASQVKKLNLGGIFKSLSFK